MTDGIRRIACDWKYVKYMRETEETAMSQQDADVLWPYVSELEWTDIVHVLDIARLLPEGIGSYITMRAAGVQHTYIAEFLKLSPAIGPEHIIRMHSVEVPPGYALDCFTAGLDVDQVLAAHVSGLPLEYATA